MFISYNLLLLLIILNTGFLHSHAQQVDGSSVFPPGPSTDLSGSRFWAGLLTLSLCCTVKWPQFPTGSLIASALNEAFSGISWILPVTSVLGGGGRRSLQSPKQPLACKYFESLYIWKHVLGLYNTISPVGFCCNGFRWKINSVRIKKSFSFGFSFLVLFRLNTILYSVSYA